jgi:hypothetical protein
LSSFLIFYKAPLKCHKQQVKKKAFLYIFNLFANVYKKTEKTENILAFFDVKTTFITASITLTYITKKEVYILPLSLYSSSRYAKTKVNI